MGDREKIRIGIATSRLSYSWLLFQLHLQGIETDKSELSSVLAGTRRGDKAEKIIAYSIDILEDYEQLFLKRITEG